MCMKAHHSKIGHAKRERIVDVPLNLHTRFNEEGSWDLLGRNEMGKMRSTRL